MRKFNKKRFTVSAIVGLIAIVIIDLLNFPSRIGINIPNLNMDIQTLIINNAVVIGLFIITYFLIDKRSIEKEKRQKECAMVFINETAKHCDEIVKLLDDKKMLKAAAEKCDFKAFHTEDKVFYSLYTSPFEYEKLVFEAASNGYITKDTLQRYLSMKSKYQLYINTRITFFDAEETGRNDIISCIIKFKSDFKKSISYFSNIGNRCIT